jgi:hypothetical protein
MYKTVGYYSNIGTSSTLPIIEPVKKKKILKSVGDWALGWNMNMDMDMDTSILENILNITPSGDCWFGHVWGGGYRYGY